MRSFIFLFTIIAVFASIENLAALARSPKISEITEISLSFGGGHFAASGSFTIVLRKNVFCVKTARLISGAEKNLYAKAITSASSTNADL